LSIREPWSRIPLPFNPDGPHRNEDDGQRHRKRIHLSAKGQAVKITVTAFPDRVFSGRIEVITPALELQSRTAEIQISIPNPGLLLKPGMFGRAEILLRANPQAVLVPIQSLMTEGGQDWLYVLKDDQVARRPVRKGAVRDTVVEILQGVVPGEQVITAGQTALKDGAKVRFTLQQPKKQDAKK
jgi:membrane fusion protein (multidrug efflux system)